MIEFKVKLPSLPPIPPMPNLGRYIMITVLVASLIMSGTSMYVTLAAPQRSIFVPSTVGFEGQLADSEGAPVADGDYAITFRLYTDSTGGTPVWQEPHTDAEHLVHVTDGLYSVQLGSLVPFAADTFNDELFLGVQVGSDGEMTPRIPVSAVPFALNAEQARGLQGYPVSDDVPGTNDLLSYNGTAWAPRDMLTLPDLAPVGSNASPNDLLQNYRSGAILRWEDPNKVTVSAGELMINGYMRRNTSTTEAILNGENDDLDTGTPQNNFTYDVYAVAPDGVSTFDLIICENGSTPTTVTNYRKLGSFRTEADSTNIVQGSAANVTDVLPHVPSARVYNSVDIGLLDQAFKVLTFNSERWDNDNIHSNSADTSRLTARTAGKYLIIGQAHISCDTTCSVSLMIRLNGSTDIARTYHHPAAFIDISTIYTLDAGQYVELLAYRGNTDSGSAYRHDAYSPEFMMIKLSD